MIKNLATKLLIKHRDKNNLYCIELIKDMPKTLTNGYDHFNTSIYNVNLNRYEELLEKIVNFSDDKGTKLFFVTPPNALKRGEILSMTQSDCTFIDKESFYDVHQLYVDKKREVAERNSVSVLDLEYFFNQVNNSDKLFFKDAKEDAVHPNKLGNYYCTELYYQMILSTLLNQNINNVNILLEQPYADIQNDLNSRLLMEDLKPLYSE